MILTKSVMLEAVQMILTVSALIWMVQSRQDLSKFCDLAHTFFNHLVDMV